MGSVLPKPIMSKVIERCGSQNLVGACSSINGYRQSMEDSHCMVLKQDCCIAGVFDGHGNDQCSMFIAERLPERLLEESRPISDAKLTQICLDVDEEYLRRSNEGGSTATFCVIDKQEGKWACTVANVGDSRTLLVRNGELLFETLDHKPHNPEERSRIEAAGGSVRLQRVDGDLAVSRAFGDGAYKMGAGSPRHHRVVAVPEISHLTLEEGDVLILACDGVFEGDFSNEMVVNFVLQYLPENGEDFACVASRVCDAAVLRGSKDNVSCMVLQLRDGSLQTSEFGETSFVPGAPFPRSHEASKQVYERMAVLGGSNLPDALKKRYKMFKAFIDEKLSSLPAIEQLAFENCDDVEISNERAFWGSGPEHDDDVAFFVALAENS